MITIDTTTGLLALVPALLLAGLGAGFMLVPAIGVVVGNAPVDKAGVASGIQQATQQLGGTLGIAVFGSLLTSLVSAQFPAVLSRVGGSDTTRLGADSTPHAVTLGFDLAAQSAQLQRLLADGTPPDRVQDLAASITTAAHETFTSGLHTVFAVAAALTVAAGLLSLLICNSSSEESEQPHA